MLVVDQFVWDLQAADVQQEAALLLGRLGSSDACKGAIRGHFGIVTLLKMVERPGLDRASKEVVVRTLSILAVDNEVNQDHIRYLTSLAVWQQHEQSWQLITKSIKITSGTLRTLSILSVDNEVNQEHIRYPESSPMWQLHKSSV